MSRHDHGSQSDAILLELAHQTVDFSPSRAAQQPVHNRGLGLSVVQAVVKRHQGWFQAHSTPGAGASFLIGLPLFDDNKQTQTD
ncbi:ATP-binding protein [Collimonas sp.]|uniref:ATP-binding protein n=1 Tax=Collimonas sp. TaxID=1963772 RepID=UPI0039C86197